MLSMNHNSAQVQNPPLSNLCALILAKWSTIVVWRSPIEGQALKGAICWGMDLLEFLPSLKGFFSSIQLVRSTRHFTSVESLTA